MQTLQIEKVEKLALEIAAHCEADVEVVLAGNGVNPCEAKFTIVAVLDILHEDGRQWLKLHETEIMKRSAELVEEFG